MENTYQIQDTKNWLSIYVSSILSFIGAAQFSLYFSSLWPYLQIIDHSITEMQFGYVVAIYSVGQIISSFAFGFWSNRVNQVRLPLFTGLIMMIVGNMFYIALPIANNWKLPMMLLSRFITGMGSGNVSLLRAYASMASSSKDRQKAIAFITCGQALGATIGPALQLLFTGLIYPGVHLFDKLYLNLYTAPAYLALLMNIIGVFALYLLFTEIYSGLEETVTDSPANPNQSSVFGNLKPQSPPYDIIAVGVCYLTRFTHMFVNTNLETLGGPLSMMMYGWTESKSVEVTALVQGAVGVFSLCFYILVIVFDLSKCLNLRVGCFLSLVGLAAFHLISYPWSFLNTSVPIYNESFAWTLELVDSPDEPTGCDVDKFAWCVGLKQINVWLYYISYSVFIGFSFPILNLTLTTLFSHVLGPIRQGTQQGMFQIFGGVARMVGPVLMSALYSNYGPTANWQMELLVLTLMITFWILFYRRMVPQSTSTQSYAIRKNNSVKDMEKGRQPISNTNSDHHF